MVSVYDHQELKKKALENPTEENLKALGEWCEIYANDDFDGEGWTIDYKKDVTLYPLVVLHCYNDGEVFQGETVGYTFSKNESYDFLEKHKVLDSGDWK